MSRVLREQEYEGVTVSHVGPVKVSSFLFRVHDLARQWMAPESLKENTYSTKSDVWMFGVTLWELFARDGMPHHAVLQSQSRAVPYKGLVSTNVAARVVTGGNGLSVKQDLCTALRE